MLQSVQGRQAYEDAMFDMQRKDRMKLLDDVLEHESKFDAFFGVIILLNLALIGLETDLNHGENEREYDISNPFAWAEHGFLSIFLVELVLRLKARFCPKGFGKIECKAATVASNDAWLLFDFCLVATSIVDVWIFRAIGQVNFFFRRDIPMCCCLYVPRF